MARSETDYVGTLWQDRDGGGVYRVVDQTDRDNATPHTVGDAIVVLRKEFGLNGQGRVTMTVRALSAEFAHFTYPTPQAGPLPEDQTV